MIRKRQLRATTELPPAQEFYSLAGETKSPLQGRLAHIQSLRQNQKEQ